MSEKINNLNQSNNLVFIANSSWYFYNFRKDLLLRLKKEGFKIYLICPKDRYYKYLQKEGFNTISWKLNRGSINIISEIFSIIDLIKKLKKIKPLLINNFTIKGSIYGSIAAFISNNSIVINSITGLGHLFLSKTISIKIIRILLIPILKIIFYVSSSKFIFQNEDDLELFINLKITSRENSSLIKGSGINTSYFKPSKVEKKEKNIILFPSRIIREKGFYELEMACNSLWFKGYKFLLYIVGDMDLGNRSSLSQKELIRLKNNRNIKLTGHVKNIKSFYQVADIVILPSWREGLSRTLLEASAMKKAIITTDVPGCRDVVKHYYNGLLVKVKDYQAIEESIIFLLKNREIAREFGEAGRKKVIKEFEVNKINNETLLLYQELISRKKGRQ